MNAIGEVDPCVNSQLHEMLAGHRASRVHTPFGNGAANSATNASRQK